MNNKKELIKNTIILFLGKFCTQFLSFFLLPLYTKYLQTQEYGIVDLITTYINLLVPIISLRLEMATFRYLIDSRENLDKTNKIISNAFFALIKMSVVAIIIILSITCFVEIDYVLIILFNVLTLMFLNLFLQISRGVGKNLSYSISCCISGGLTIILNVFLIVVCNLGVLGMLVSILVSNLCATIFLFFNLKLYKKINKAYKNTELLKEMLKYSLPLIPNGISWWIVTVSDRTIISWFIGVTANGIYAVANKFSSLFIGVFGVFNLSWTESVSLHIKDKDNSKFISDVINEAIKISSCICLGIISIMPFIFPILINKQYGDAYNYIPILLLSTIFNIVVSLYSAVYIALKMTNKVAMTSTIAAAINIIINLLLINKIKIYAAAISTVFAYFIMAIYRHIDVQKYIKIKLDYKFICSCLLLFVYIMISYYINNFVLNIISFIVVCIYSIIYNKKIIYIVFNKIKQRIK